MRAIRLTGLLVMVLVSDPCPFVAQQSYVHQGSIGNTDKLGRSSNDPFATRPITSWVGERFIFLPRPKSLQKYGYYDVRQEGHEDIHLQYPYVDIPTYEELAGKIGKVLEAKIENMHLIVRLRLEESGVVYVVKIPVFDNIAKFGYVDGIGPVADIDTARRLFLNKTLWYAGTKLETYDANTDESKTTKVKKLLPWKVTNIVAGWYNNFPIRFILRSKSGVEGYVDVHLTGTNVSETLRDRDDFRTTFFVQDPHTLFKWTERIWAAIANEKVFAGMTKQQALMSWGHPEEIHRTILNNTSEEQWVYSVHSYLYFRGDFLQAMQD